MEHIRILLLHMPRMLRDILSAAIQAESDMSIVAEATEFTSLGSVADRVRTDVVITGIDDGEIPEACRELVDRYPNMKVLAVEAAGRKAWLYELRPHRSLVAEVSPSGLIDTIRAALRPARI